MIQKIFISILFFLTISAPLGLFLRIDTLRKIGLASLSSPLLIVYSEVNGKKLMSYKYKMEIEYKNKETQIIELDKYKYLELSKKENLFNRHIIIIPYMAASFILYGDEKNLELRKSILEYGLCNNGVYSKYLDLEHQVKTANFYINDNNKIINEFFLNCS